MKIASLALAVALAAPAMAAPAMALAHAHVEKTEPVRNAAVKAAAAVSVTFSEAVTPAFTGAEVDGADGKAVATGKPSFDKARKTMTLPIAGALKPGAYTVKWHAVSVDTHRVSGSFGFSITG